MRRCVLVALLAVFLSGCFSPSIKIGGEKPLVDIKYGGKNDKDRDKDDD